MSAEAWENALDDAWPRWGGRAEIVRVLAQVAADAEAVVRAEVLREARDDLYAGMGPDLVADSDIVYGEWLGNRADQIEADR